MDRTELYFAYGSNLDEVQMRERCDQHAFRCIAALPGYKLVFNRFSRVWGGGVADIVPSRDSIVWGVVYELTTEDLSFLDGKEGYYDSKGYGSRGKKPSAYDRTQQIVLIENDSEQPMSVWTYEVRAKERVHVPPTRDYLSKIVEGARRWNLPEDYIQSIENAPWARM